MYEEIRDISMVQQSYASNFYSDFIYTPGFLVPRIGIWPFHSHGEAGLSGRLGIKRCSRSSAHFY